jgi:hypothetical protein
MKKVLLAVAVVAFLASCKKDYTCTCVDTSTTPSTTETISYPGLSKTEADAAELGCSALTFSNETCTWAQD